MRGLQQGARNAQDGISMIQVAEGGISEISNISVRLRELAVQAASDTIGPDERKFLNVEFEALLSEVDRIANSTMFNRVPLLNGTGSIVDIQVGTGNNPSIDRITFDLHAAPISIRETPPLAILREQGVNGEVEMAAAFGDYPDALQNTMRIAERCNVRIAEGENFLPNFDVPAGFTLDGRCAREPVEPGRRRRPVARVDRARRAPRADPPSRERGRVGRSRPGLR